MTLEKWKKCKTILPIAKGEKYPHVEVLRQYSLHWVLRPTSVKGFEVVKANGGRYINWISAWYSDQTVAKSNFGVVQT